MAFGIRRVVTGHDPEGRATVVADDRIPAANPRPGQEVYMVWANGAVPADNGDTEDGPTRADGARLPGGGVFRVVRYDQGARGNMHRTQTLDYGVVMSGSITLEVDDGQEVALTAGDVLVQRGTIHRWSNPGSEPCIIAFVLLDALPLQFHAVRSRAPIDD